jgi:hypothetical protein
MFDGTVVKIVSSKKRVQMIVCYSVVDTLTLVERKCCHHLKTWCCPMPQNFVRIQSITHKVLTQPLQLNATLMKIEM